MGRMVFLCGAAAIDTTPDAFTFTDVVRAALNTEYVSNEITIAGINSAAAVTVTGGTYSKNGGAYTSAAGTVVNGDTLTVKRNSSAVENTGVDVVLTVGGVSDTFSITTGVVQNDIVLSTYNFDPAAVEGAVIATISGRITGDTIVPTPSNGMFTVLGTDLKAGPLYTGTNGTVGFSGTHPNGIETHITAAAAYTFTYPVTFSESDRATLVETPWETTLLKARKAAGSANSFEAIRANAWIPTNHHVDGGVKVIFKFRQQTATGTIGCGFATSTFVLTGTGHTEALGNEPNGRSIGFDSGGNAINFNEGSVGTTPGTLAQADWCYVTLDTTGTNPIIDFALAANVATVGSAGTYTIATGELSTTDKIYAAASMTAAAGGSHAAGEVIIEVDYDGPFPEATDAVTAGFVPYGSVAQGAGPPPNEVTATSDADLVTKLGVATSGQTIYLPASSSFAYVGVSNKTFPGVGVTLRSADPLNPATVAGIELTNVDKMSIRDLIVTPATSRSTYAPPIKIIGGCTYITVDNCETKDHRVSQVSATYKSEAVTAYNTLISSMQALSEYATWLADPGYPATTGNAAWEAWQAAILVDATCISNQSTLNAKLGASANSIDGSDNIVWTNNTTHFMAGGANFQDCDYIDVTDNAVEDIFADGLDFYQVTHGNILRNTGTRLYNLPGDHTDFIQFGTQGTTTASTDILIDSNVYTRGVGGADAQGIFGNNEIRIPYERFTISNNSLTGCQYSGISFGLGTDFYYTNNTVNPHTDIPSYIQYQEMTNITITGNHVVDLSYIRSFYPDGLSTGVSISGNFADQTPVAPPT